MPSVYVIFNEQAGKGYIGQTIQKVEKRWRHHRNYLRTGTHRNCHLQRSWNKYGEDAFIFKVLAELPTKEEAFDMEINLIADLKSKGFELYNLSSGGEGGSPSAETRKKLSDALKGRPKSPEQKAIIAAMNKERAQTEAHRQHIIESNKKRAGQPLSEKRKQSLKALAESNRGRPCSEQTRKIRAENSRKQMLGSKRPDISKTLTGRKLSEEHKQHIREGQMRRWYPDQFPRSQSALESEVS